MDINLVEIVLDYLVVLVGEDKTVVWEVLEIHHQYHHHKEIMAELDQLVLRHMEAAAAVVLAQLDLTELQPQEVREGLEHHLLSLV